MTKWIHTHTNRGMDMDYTFAVYDTFEDVGDRFLLKTNEVIGMLPIHEDDSIYMVQKAQ